MRTARPILALTALLASALALAACGGGGSVPGDAVASVNGNAITKTDFQHWMTVAANSQATSPTQKTPVPDPPNYTNCIANLRKTTPKPAKGKPTPTDAQFKAQCAQQYSGLRDQVLNFLISADWLTGEASDQGVKVSDSEVQKAFDKTKKQSFPKPAQYASFLKRTGYTTQDLLLRQKLQIIQQKIVAKVTKGTGTVTPAQISAYYDKNKARFAQPERRDLRIVLTKTKAKADQALKAIQSGQSFASVAKKFSIDQASKSQGGKLLGVAKGQQERAFDQAVFAAPKGKLEGPVKTQFGYYVFKVEKITPASQQSLKQATPTIKQILSAQNRQNAIDKFAKNWQKKWKSKTDCRTGFVIPSCSNAPKPKATTTPTTGAPPAPNTTATTG